MGLRVRLTVRLRVRAKFGVRVRSTLSHCGVRVRLSLWVTGLAVSPQTALVPGFGLCMFIS